MRLSYANKIVPAYTCDSADPEHHQRQRKPTPQLAFAHPGSPEPSSCCRRNPCCSAVRAWVGDTWLAALVRCGCGTAATSDLQGAQHVRGQVW